VEQLWYERRLIFLLRLEWNWSHWVEFYLWVLQREIYINSTAYTVQKDNNWQSPPPHLAILTPGACLATTTGARATVTVHWAIGFWCPVFQRGIGLDQNVLCLLELLLEVHDCGLHGFCLFVHLDHKLIQFWWTPSL